jgi:hypothetical protein
MVSDGEGSSRNRIPPQKVFIDGTEDYGKQKKQEVLPEIKIPVHRVKTFANKFIKIIRV